MSLPGFEDRRFLRLSLLALQAAALILLMGSTFWKGFPLDDAWIHQQVARTFATSGTLGLYPGQPCVGATSYLWALVLSLAHLLPLPAQAPVLFAHLLNAFLFLGSGQLTLSLLLADGFAPKLAWMVALCFACAGNAVWFAGSGMEATGVIFLSLLAIRLWQRADKREGSVAASVAAVGLFLLRPETVMLIPTLLVLSGRPTLRSVLRMLVPLTGVMTLYVLLNLALIGQMMPTTMAGRSWLYFGAWPWRLPWERSLDMLLALVDRLGPYTLGTGLGGVFWLAFGFALHGAWTFVDRGTRGLGALALWTLVHLATFAVLYPNLGQGGRYLPLVPGVFLAFTALGLVSIGSMLARARDPKNEPRILLATLLCGLSLIVLVQWRSWHRSAVEHINLSEVEMGKLLATLPAPARIASFDLGAMSYFSQHRILDLGGLADPALVPLLWSGRVAEYLHKMHVDYVVLPVSSNDRYPGLTNFRYRLGLGNPEIIRLVPIAHRESDPETWLRGMLATWNASPRQRLYKIEGFGGRS